MSDFIGIYTSVRAESKGIPTILASGVGKGPSDIARWITQNSGFVTTTPRSVKIGGLKGIVLDIVLVKSAGTGCPGDSPPPYLAVIMGTAPTSLDHRMIPGLTLRLILLSFRGGTLAIEVDDVAGGGQHLAEYSTLIKDLRFST